MKTRFFLLCIVLLSFLTLNAFASVDVRSIFITTNEGLANNSVRYLFQDSKGFVWMGTLDGLSRYDGHSFVTFRPGIGDEISLADHHVKVITEDRNGFLWIFTSPEIFSCYDLKRDCFVDYTGCGEYKQEYKRKLETSTGDIWLWHNEKNGCRKITYKDGHFSSVIFDRKNGKLFSDSVNYVHEDEQGSVWICTQAGLVWVAGNQTQLFKKELSFVAAVTYEKKNFFLASNGQIYEKTPGKGLRLVAQLPWGISPAKVYEHSLVQDDWVIFSPKGGAVFRMSEGRLVDDPSLNIPLGRCIRDNLGNLWISNGTGEVSYLNIRTRELKNFRLMSYEKAQLVADERFWVVQDARGLIWISTYGNGLFVYNSKTDEMTHYTYHVERFNRINSDFILYIMGDRTGNIWLGSEYSGIALLSVLNEGATRIYPENDTLVDRSNTIRMVTCTENGDIWVGNRRGGLFHYDTNLQLLDKKNYKLSVFDIAEDHERKLWMATRGAGLSIDGKWYTNQSKDANSLAHNHIYDVFRDFKGRMWIGTFGGGLDLAIPANNSYIFRHFLAGSYSKKQVRTITADKNNWMWVGTNNGVYVFHPDSLIENSKSYYTYNFDNGKLRSNEIRNVFCDSKGCMWIGTTGTGFALCSPGQDYKNLSFQYYDTNNGLVNNVVQSIVEDLEGKIWLGTEYGMSCFDPVTRTFDNFFFSAVMPGNVYLESSACTTKDGRLLFGTNHGLVVINPQMIQSQRIVSPIVLTDLKINGISVRPGDVDSPLTTALSYTNGIELQYFQNSFSIEFSTFDYSMGNDAKYIYQLIPFDKDWSTPSSLNFAAYKNLPPGNYQLHVKACNASGVWGTEETVLQIVIAPPFWKTTWAYMVYIILVCIALYITFRLVRNFNTLRTRIQLEKQLTEYKLIFFTNISHEFRTPLTLIQGALEKIESSGKRSKELAYPIKIMDKSTQRLMRLVNQLLEFRKMQNNKLSLSLEETDVVVFLHDIFQSFRETAETKGMEFVFTSSVNSYSMFIDKGKLDKIVYNLISNAFKYTPAGGKITCIVQVEQAIGKLFFSVADTGVGIPKEKRSQLFSRFMQSSFSNDSMGIGLHLTHELVKVHKGTIGYTENEGGGSVFTVTLPLDCAVYSEKDFLVTTSLIEEVSTEMKEMGTKVAPALPTLQEEQNSAPLNRKKILIIEDDTDIREFLKREISVYFEVVAEADGTLGFERARTYDADLIICDVLMPGMNGYEVTRKLKNEFSTSHIPIILLTAMGTTENKLEGVESGADAYVTKPFSLKLLLARIFQLIKQREMLREKFLNEPGAEHAAVYASDKDKQFLDKLQAVINKELGNAEFSMEDFAARMKLGRTLFYKKVRGLTGYTPNDYLRLFRLKKAAELLSEGNYNVSEISYKVGISDPLYFSRCFKQQFGVSPSVYLHGKKEE